MEDRLSAEVLVRLETLEQLLRELHDDQRRAAEKLGQRLARIEEAIRLR